jgi:anti-anti-sigma factor
MTIQNWSDEIIMAELAEDPAIAEDINVLGDMVQEKPRHVVLNFAALDFLNSSNIAKLLKLRKQTTSLGRRLILCAINTQVWGVFLVTGLDKIFDYTNETATAWATLQMGQANRKAPKPQG